MNDPESPPEKQDDRPLSLMQVIGSAISAAFGVQSSQNRERDFARGKLSHFIAVGIGLTIAFVVILIVVVNLVLSNVS
ncbi:MAG: DUF2970 domain-containing protein [Gammaproteobacteria bacterium]|nr:DUF2970 domain-containing protein [Gammaproteobacteria bacterium]MCZ6852511.1 DUF2970 domain-containing protein [Gammaproteobacteria bacterium]